MNEIRSCRLHLLHKSPNLLVNLCGAILKKKIGKTSTKKSAVGIMILTCVLPSKLTRYTVLFFRINCLKKFLHEYHWCQQFGSNLGLTFVQPDLGTNCMQMLSADSKIHQGKSSLTILMT